MMLAEPRPGPYPLPALKELGGCRGISAAPIMTSIRTIIPPISLAVFDIGLRTSSMTLSSR